MVVRQYPRFPALFPGTLVYQNRSAATKALDLSRKGCRLKNTVSVVSGACVDLLLYVPGDEIPLLIQGATVRWSGLQGIGIEFQPIAAPHQVRLETALRRLERTTNN
jgi:hypothetical protein